MRTVFYLIFLISFREMDEKNRAKQIHILGGGKSKHRVNIEKNPS